MDLQGLVGHEVKVIMTREPFTEYINLLLDNGYTEELGPEETKKWFLDHGVTDVLGLESALDYVWNFYEHVIRIENFRIPKVAHPSYQPQI